MMLLTNAELGRIAYAAYVADAGGKSLVSGATLPEWEELKAPIRSAWIAAARAVKVRVQTT